MDIKDIKAKFKQFKYQHLKKIYAKNLSTLPENCKYNKRIKLPNRSRINICGFNFEDTFEVDLCYKVEHAVECNAFCLKKSKEGLYNQFMEELEDDQIRSTKYKDLNTLYWLFPDLKLEDFPYKEKWYHRIYRFLKG